MSEPTRIRFALTRRQRLRLHAGIWLRRWRGLLVLLILTAGVLWLTFNVSKWFLLILFSGIPPFGNLAGLVLGFVVPFFIGRPETVLTLDAGRIGHGRPGWPLPRWLRFDEIVVVERHGDVWVLAGKRREVVAIPVAAIPAAVIEEIRATPDRYCERLAGYAGPDPAPT